MHKNESSNQKSIAILVDPDTEKLLGRISFVGNPVPATEWILTNGPLQGFEIIDGRDQLQKVWAYQKEVLLRTSYGRCFVRLVTYPTEDENQGYLDYTSDFEILPETQSEPMLNWLRQRGIALLQSIFSIP